MIDRRALVGRHDPVITAPSPEDVVTLGNGDFAYTADITGMQTFTAFHDQLRAPDRTVIDTTTMSTWGWHEMPDPGGFELDDATTVHESSRGPVGYPDLYPDSADRDDTERDLRAGIWLHRNPHRIDLGRIGFTFRDEAGEPVEVEPTHLDSPRQVLDLWNGVLSTDFGWAGERVRVVTIASPSAATVVFRVRSPLLSSGRLTIGFRFPFASTQFAASGDWNAPERHTSTLRTLDGRATIERELDATRYRLELPLQGAAIAEDGPHRVELRAAADELELVVDLIPDGAPSPRTGSFDDVRRAAARSWNAFWSAGAAIDLAGSADPRAHELERRIVLSQWLTAVNCAGHQPPQETGLITNSWFGKFHLEMHWWHAAHFPMWARPELLERSLPWYRSILDRAEETARRQGFAGARWPKQVGPDGRESPSSIGPFLVWQQPHLLSMLELVWQASDASHRSALVAEHLPLIRATADFMASFAEERHGVFHLPAPLIPAQEAYRAETTEDPAFELAYWGWGLELAQRWLERAGLARDAGWERVRLGLATPHIRDGVYTAIGSEPFIRPVDHPSHLAALGFVPPSPLIDPDIMRATLESVRETWDLSTAWGWDFPVMAMTAIRLGQPALALELLLADEPKNGFSAVGHNRQVPGVLPLYLPGNGGLLAAVALLASSVEGREGPEGWSWRAEGFVPWPD